MCISSSEIHAQGGWGCGGGNYVKVNEGDFFLSNDPTANWQWIKGLNDVFKITFLRSALTLKPENQNREINEASIETAAEWEHSNLQTRRAHIWARCKTLVSATQLAHFI